MAKWVKYWESAIMVLSIVGGLALVYRVDPRQIMPVVYMALFFVQEFAAGIIAIRYMANIHRAPLMMPIARHLAFNGLAILLLALSAGDDPWLDIATLRRWIVYVRIQLVVSGLVLVIKGAGITWRMNEFSD